MKILAAQRLRQSLTSAIPTFEDFVQAIDKVEKELKHLKLEQDKIVEKLGGKGPSGLTPDHIRKDPKYAAIDRKTKAKFKHLQDLNQHVQRHFKKEAKELRDKRRAERWKL